MRDFRDAKPMAQSIRAALAAKGHKITIAESLELVARAFGAADWNTLSAAIKTAAEAPAEPQAPLPDSNAAFDRIAMALGWSDWDTLTAALRTVAPDQPGRRAPDDRGAPLGPAPARRTGTWFSPAMQASLHRAVALAAERKHGYTTLEHLLLALIEDKDAAAVMTACQANLDALKAKLVRYIDTEYERLTQMGDPQNTPPTAGFHRAVQRAVVQVQTSGHGEVTGANLLVAMFAERESHAFVFLQTQGMTQRDAVNFMAHGIRNGGAAS